MRKTVEVSTDLIINLFDMMRMLADGEKPHHTFDEAEDSLRPYVALARMPLYHFEGRLHFQRSTGNPYHTCRVYENGELLWTSGHSYGSGDQYLDTGVRWLVAQGKLSADAKAYTLYIRETMHSTCSCREVTREKDL